MRNVFRKISILITVVVFLNIFVFAQSDEFSAPVKWEKYKVSENSVSLSLPKLPVLIAGGNVCSEEESKQYAVYADDVVYGLNIYSKSKNKAPVFCESKKKFDKSNFNDRLEEIKKSLQNSDESKFTQNNFEIVKVKNESRKQIYWLINDFENKRWFELWTVNADEEKTEVKNFIESVKIGNNPDGIEIEKGSPRTLGDKEFVGKSTGSNKQITEGIRIVVKPRANYTDVARQANVQGTVTLRVTFLANGGIGSVTPLTGLPYGLTEQAIAAASRLVFLPGRKDGIKISATKVVQYSFTIY